MFRKRKRQTNKKPTAISGNSVHENVDVDKLIDGVPVKKIASTGQKIDWYCWMCHKVGQEVHCSSCPRVFHTACLQKAGELDEKGICPECQIHSVCGLPPSQFLSGSNLNKVLILAVERCCNQPLFLKEWPERIDNYKLFKPIDLFDIDDKLHNGIPYTETADLYKDIKWINHNCCIIYGVNSLEVAASKKMMTDFKNELRNIESCPMCYYNCYSGKLDASECFIQICDADHDIVWAKLKGYRFWPAKCFSINGSKADIRFFGTHDQSYIPVSNCFLMSDEYPQDPNLKLSTFRSTEVKPKWVYKRFKGQNNLCSFEDSIHELLEYITKYEMKKGPFVFANVKTRLITEKAKKNKSRKRGKCIRNSQKKRIVTISKVCSLHLPDSDGQSEHHDDGNSTSTAIPSTSAMDVSPIVEEPDTVSSVSDVEIISEERNSFLQDELRLQGFLPDDLLKEWEQSSSLFSSSPLFRSQPDDPNAPSASSSTSDCLINSLASLLSENQAKQDNVRKLARILSVDPECMMKQLYELKMAFGGIILSYWGKTNNDRNIESLGKLYQEICACNTFIRKTLEEIEQKKKASKCTDAAEKIAKLEDQIEKIRKQIDELPKSVEASYKTKLISFNEKYEKECKEGEQKLHEEWSPVLENRRKEKLRYLRGLKNRQIILQFHSMKQRNESRQKRKHTNQGPSETKKRLK